MTEKKYAHKLLINLTTDQREWLRKQPDGAAAKLRHMIENEMRLDELVIDIFPGKGERNDNH